MRRVDTELESLITDPVDRRIVQLIARDGSRLSRRGPLRSIVRRLVLSRLSARRREWERYRDPCHDGATKCPGRASSVESAARHSGSAASRSEGARSRDDRVCVRGFEEHVDAVDLHDSDVPVAEDE
jgi:hypothetical protein